MTQCTHDLAERETACADGMCPICKAAEIERLRAALQSISDLPPRADRDMQAVLIARGALLHGCRVTLVDEQTVKENT